MQFFKQTVQQSKKKLQEKNKIKRMNAQKLYLIYVKASGYGRKHFADNS